MCKSAMAIFRCPSIVYSLSLSYSGDRLAVGLADYTEVHKAGFKWPLPCVRAAPRPPRWTV